MAVFAPHARALLDAKRQRVEQRDREAEHAATGAAPSSSAPTDDWVRSYLRRVARRAGRRGADACALDDAFEELRLFGARYTGVPHGGLRELDRAAITGGGGGGGVHAVSERQLRRRLVLFMDTLNSFDSVPYRDNKTYERSVQQCQMHRRMTVAVAMRLFDTQLERALPWLRKQFPDVEDVNRWMWLSAPRRWGKTMLFALFVAAAMLTLSGWRIVLFSTARDVSHMIVSEIVQILVNAGHQRQIMFNNHMELVVRTLGDAGFTYLKMPSSDPKR
jgi:hypothetical protein